MGRLARTFEQIREKFEIHATLNKIDPTVENGYIFQLGYLDGAKDVTDDMAKYLRSFFQEDKENGDA